MRRLSIHIMLSLSIIALTAAGCASQSGKGMKMMQMDAKRITSDTGTVDIMPKKFHEVCMMMAMGESMEYTFTSTTPTDFNLHMHVDDKVLYPIKDEGVSTGTGTYTAEREDIYCLMWTNTSEITASLTYDCKLKGPKE